MPVVIMPVVTSAPKLIQRSVSGRSWRRKASRMALRDGAGAALKRLLKRPPLLSACRPRASRQITNATSSMLNNSGSTATSAPTPRLKISWSQTAEKTVATIHEVLNRLLVMPRSA